MSDLARLTVEALAPARRVVRGILRLVPRSLWLFLARRGLLVSFSQFGEDVWVLANFSAPVSERSVVVEVGSFDGVTYSNTALFEARLGARAVLIEPSPKRARQSANLRAEAQVFQVAIDTEFDVKEFAGDQAVSGLLERMSVRYRESWGIDSLSRFFVPTLPVGHLLERVGVERVSFMSIDVQGSELEVLHSLGSEIQVDLFCIEMESHFPEKDDACREWLNERGFVFIRRLGVSEIWVNPGVLSSGNLIHEVRLPFFSPYASLAARNELRHSHAELSCKRSR